MKPHYATEFSAGADLQATETVTINPGEFKMIPTGYAPDHDDFSKCAALLLFARSSLSFKKGLMLGNGVGLIDADFRDEVKVILTNITQAPVTIEKGERVAQLMPVSKEGMGEVSSWPVSRDLRQGGFGSTGGYRSIGDCKEYGA